MRNFDRNITFAAAVALALSAGVAVAQQLSPELTAFREIYRELVEINTTDSVGDTVRAAEAMAARLRAGGFPAQDIRVLSSGPRKGHMVARLRGTGAGRPILLLAHLDVVEARREDWASDPFKLQEVDGYFRARGAIDDKAMASIFVANLIEYVKQGFKPERDIILALTADEELSDSPHNGVRWLLENHRELIDAEFAINEGGGSALRGGRPFRLSLQLAMAAVETPEMAEAIRALLAGRTDAATLAPLSDRPDYNAQIRTTCVATLLTAGHAENALPQSARATVNCRILPDEPVKDVERTLVRVIADEKVAVTPKGIAVLSPPSGMKPEVMQIVARLGEEMWPGVPLNAVMSTGYTDSRWLRNAGIPAYGVSGLFTEQANNGVHGLNEQVGVQALYDSHTFLYRLVKTLAKKGPPTN